MAISLFKRQVISLKKDPYVPTSRLMAAKSLEALTVAFAPERGSVGAGEDGSVSELAAPPARVSVPLELIQGDLLLNERPLPPPEPEPVVKPEATATGAHFDLSTITVGIGWKIREGAFSSEPPSLGRRLLNLRFVKNTLLGRWLGGGGDHEFDLDVIAFLLDKNGQVFEMGDKYMVGSDVIFFNNPRHFTGGVLLRGDNRIGGAGVQDEEQIVAKLSQLKSCYEKVRFMVSIYDGQNKQQHFGQLKDAYIRALDGKGREIACCELDKNPFYVGRCLLVFADVMRFGANWKFQLIGEAHSSDNFESVLADHLPLN